MRSRKPRSSDGLLNGVNGSSSKGYRYGWCHARMLLRLAAALLVVAWTFLVYLQGANIFSGGRFSWLSRLDTSDDSSRANLPQLSADEADKPKHDRKHKHKSSRRNKPPDLPVCTPSLLEERQSYPIYGCAEMEEILEGPTTFLGQGYWREVRLAEYNGQQVAIKTLRDTQEETQRNLERHRWEAVALDAVKGHPNIVHLLGLCECDMITEYFPIYMDELLLREDSFGKVQEISDETVIRMALDAARGLRALHEAPGGPIVHADLQPRQLLLDESGVVKVNDLNRCRFMGRDSSGDPCPFTINKGNGVWRSPEEYAGEPLTEKLDIYSMGNIFWAMFGRDAPFPRDEYYKGRVLDGERPAVDPSWHPDFVQLFRDMWKREPTERPDAGEVVKRLEKMLAALQARS